ncbi:uncharacterized, partial [Tachysurus ichikawai]
EPILTERSRVESYRAKPNRAESYRAEPSRVEPSPNERSRALLQPWGTGGWRT